MAGKIFYRERRKVGEKEKKPRFKLVAIAGVDMRFYSEHLRKKELEDIAKAVGAELVLLESGKDKDDEIELKD
ncbi:MAG: hypothetical protein CVU61_00445 [Deltaproteobacteria bacterium HGW-Deltaproteobacteria-19]|jgi:hypothetical protein|nr:MAG: hypothetical protein CVU61_00445 [Deltaproteobacteria bacterium HGW-Deltaproteobacteria-19]